jgi:hypothetical protein
MVGGVKTRTPVEFLNGHKDLSLVTATSWIVLARDAKNAACAGLLNDATSDLLFKRRHPDVFTVRSCRRKIPSRGFTGKFWCSWKTLAQTVVGGIREHALCNPAIKRIPFRA